MAGSEYFGQAMQSHTCCNNGHNQGCARTGITHAGIISAWPSLNTYILRYLKYYFRVDYKIPTTKIYNLFFIAYWLASVASTDWICGKQVKLCWANFGNFVILINSW